MSNAHVICTIIASPSYLDHWKHPPSILCDDHLVGEAPELVPKPRVLQLHPGLSLRGHVRGQGRGHVGQEVAGDSHGAAHWGDAELCD